MAVRKTAKKPRRISPNDSRFKESYKSEIAEKAKKKDKSKPAVVSDENGLISADQIVEKTPISSAMFFEYNTALGPPYRILLDTNFVNFSIQTKMDLHKGIMDCLLAKCVLYVTDCVVGELEKMGHRYKLALRLVKDGRVEKLKCSHKGTYADDCIVNRVTDYKCYIVATNDVELKRRIRKIPGIPIMSVAKHKYIIERMPDLNMKLNSLAKFKPKKS